MLEDRPLQLLEIGRWFDPELVDENASRLVVGLERLGLAAGPVQRQHELGPEPLAERMKHGQLLELTNHIEVTGERQIGVKPLLEHRETRFLKSLAGRCGKRRLGELGERQATPQGQRVAKPRRRVSGPPRRQRLISLSDSHLKPLKIELAWRELDDVARTTRLDHILSGAGPFERLSQLGDPLVEGADTCRRRRDP